MNFITLKELKKMVPVASEFKRVPGLKKILEDGIEVILRKQMENHAEVVVYKNGYVSYHAHERYTVFALHNCTHYYYESQGNEHQTIPHNHFEDMEWHIRLVLEGEDRLVRNLEARESETFSYAADVNPEYNNEMEDPRINVMDKIVQKMTKDGLVDENLRTGEQKSATAEEKPEKEDSAKETAEKETDEETIVEEERCMDAGGGEEDAPRHHSTAKQSADYYKAHQEEGKPKDALAEADVEPQTKKGRLSFEDEKGGIVRGMGMGVKKVAKKGVDTATGYAHQKVHQVEKDNSGVEAAHKSEEAAERLHHFVKGRKKPKDKSARAEKRGGEDQKSSRLKFSESEGGTAENAAEPQLKKKQPQPPPTAAGGESKTVGAKFYQKKQYKDAYAAAKRGQKAGTAASKQAAATNTITEKAKAAVQEIVAQNKTLWVSIGVGILLVMVMLGAFSSCGAAIQGTGSTFVGTTYPSKDADMKGAEEDYLELEKELDKQIRQMESTHPGYDEYRYQLDEIGHDPYQLISHLTAVYEQFTRGQVKPVIKELFKQQYLLKVWETIEIRTRMETRVGIRPTIDAFGNISMETYTYQEEVEYEYKILNVLLKNKGFDPAFTRKTFLSENRKSDFSFHYFSPTAISCFYLCLMHNPSSSYPQIVMLVLSLFTLHPLLHDNKPVYRLQ